MRVNEGSISGLRRYRLVLSTVLFPRSKVRRTSRANQKEERATWLSRFLACHHGVGRWSTERANDGGILAEPITFLRIALQRGRPSPRDYGYTRLPTLVRSKEGCGSRRRPDVSPAYQRTIFAMDMHALVAVCCRRYLCRYTYYLPFNLRLPTPLNQERSNRRSIRE